MEKLTIDTINEEGFSDVRMAVVLQEIKDASNIIAKYCMIGYSPSRIDKLLYGHWKWLEGKWCKALVMEEISADTLKQCVIQRANDELVRRTFAKSKIYSHEAGKPPARTRSEWEELGYTVTGSNYQTVSQFTLVRGNILKRYFEKYYTKEEVEQL